MRMIDNMSNAESFEPAKIKTHFAEIIVGGTCEKPCYHIMYFDPTDREYHTGFSSFCLEYVFKWLSDEFEIIDEQPTIDAVEVVRCKECIRWMKDVAGCTDFVGRCAYANYMIGATGYCLYGERRGEA